MSEDRAAGFPHWLRDVDATLPVTAQYVVHGNIRDRHLVASAAGGPTLRHTVDALWQCLAASGYEFLLHHSVPHGLRVWPRDGSGSAVAAGLLADLADRVGGVLAPAELAEVLRRVARSSTTRCALVIDYMSQAQPAGEPPSADEHQLMLTALAQVHDGHGHPKHSVGRAALYNPTFWFVDQPSDLPGWMVAGSDGIRQIPVPSPDLDTRREAAALLVRSLPGAATETEETREQAADDFASLSEGLTLRSMIEVGQLAIDRGWTGAHIDDAVRAYRLGLLENPWSKSFLRDRIRDGEGFLTSQVRGQDRAVRHALDILIRSTTGLTAAHTRGASTGPRGVLFFAGPTGVGKTELAKGLTRLVFGDERAYIRFDMSEFASEHTEARLIGSPPGYVGHGVGGELTNAVRQKPFSLLLFDEIEKAHPRILDKFLQILSDGRLTDGSGDTVHFSESIIVFTSNLGVREDSWAPDDAASTFEQRVRRAIERDFQERLDRPELLGRIGDNIVVFDYISDDVAAELARGFVANVQAKVQREMGVALQVDEEVQQLLVKEATQDLSKGGRGIGLKLESVFVNPLARAVFDLPEGVTRATVAALDRDDQGWWTVRLS